MSAPRFLYTAAPLAVLAVTGMGLASAQSSSPFASKTKTQAWETPVRSAAPTPSQYSASQYPQYSATQYNEPAVSTASSAPRAMRTYSATTPPRVMPGDDMPIRTAPVRNMPPAGSDYNYAPKSAPRVSNAPDFGSPALMAGGAAKPASPYARTTPRTQAWETPAQSQSQPAQGYSAPQEYGAPQGSPIPPQQNGYQPSYQQNGYQPSYQQPYPPTGVPHPTSQGPTSYPAPQQPQSWKDRLGLSNLATVLRGKLNLGAAATYRDQPPNQLGPDDAWSEDFIADAEIEAEVSAITQGGLEYGVNLGVRAQYDGYRRGFGGRLADCPPTVAGCSGAGVVQIAGLPVGLRGHTSGFYSAGEDTAKDGQFQLESAHVFLRSAYGDVTVGRDDGAAYLFSLGAPTLLAMGASNSAVDYTGYDSVKTINDASGFAAKATYTSPRLLGDQIGVGVQLGASYTPKADACGVDYCVDRDVTGVIRPDIEDVIEAGLALDRTFENGMSVEGTFTYARGSETSGLNGLDDLESFGAGLELGYGDWTLGGSWLQSNNGLLDGDYTAYDAGVTWKPGALGFTLGYGHAKDDNVNLTSDQAVFGVTYDFDKFTLGTGVQYIDRTSDGLVGGVLTPLDQTATSVFVQGGFKF